MTDGVSLSEYSLCFTKLYVQCSKTDAWSFSIGKKFIGGLHSLSRMHWDHEPERGQRRASVPPAQRARQRERFHSVGVADGGRRDACPTLRFMESLLSLLRMHWDHEPTPNPSQEGNGQDADRCLFPSWEGSGVGRFMERIATAQDVPHVALSLGTGNMPPGTTRAAPGQP